MLHVMWQIHISQPLWAADRFGRLTETPLGRPLWPPLIVEFHLMAAAFACGVAATGEVDVVTDVRAFGLRLIGDAFCVIQR